ncbi:DUF4869 domain-containing protein [Ruminococcus sp. HUN007]|uniref:DUF4869 domain-containing protein n=1 Tax=Ruminococcus sp. HUN007 TaxID=1514668 RepID=UPI00325BEF6C
MIKFLMHQTAVITVPDGFWKWAGKKDVVINLRHLMDFGDGQFDVEIMNTGETVHNMYDLAVKAGRFV